MMVACQLNMSSPTGPAEQLAGGSLPKSCNSWPNSAESLCATLNLKLIAVGLTLITSGTFQAVHVLLDSPERHCALNGSSDRSQHSLNSQSGFSAEKRSVSHSVTKGSTTRACSTQAGRVSSWTHFIHTPVVSVQFLGAASLPSDSQWPLHVQNFIHGPLSHS